jgi:hypothetical protein
MSTWLTAGLDYILGVTIACKLYRARRAVLAHPHEHDLGTWYARLASFIAESALLWIINSITCVVTVFMGLSISLFFEQLFEITTVNGRVVSKSWGFT